MNAIQLWKLFHRPGARGSSGHISALAVIAFAAATAIFLTVLGGVHGFLTRASADGTLRCLVNQAACAPGAQERWSHRIVNPDDIAYYASNYVVLAIFACILLVVPFVSLAGSAARLAASRRDQRLAALRLAGASQGQVMALAALDATGQALLGALFGISVYAAGMPLIMLLSFQGTHFTLAELWVGPLALLVTVLGVTLLALVSSLLTLRRVAITPLGVTARHSQPLPAKWRAVVFVAVFVVALAALGNMQLFSGLGTVAVYAISFGFIALPFALVNLIGSWLVAARVRAKARHPKDAATMIAVRRILDNPKRAWRNVSGIALAVFIAGLTSIASFFSEAGGSATDSAAAIFFRDIGTGGLLTLVFAAVLAAVSSGVMQAGSVYDQANEYRMLVLEGTDTRTLNRARFIEVLMPLKTVVVVGAACSFALMMPMFAQAMTSPGTLLSFAGGIALCFALVSFGALASNRVAARLNLADYRADD